MVQISPTEVTYRYATTVESLPNAWSFIMEHLESVGPSPSIKITPTWVISDDPDDHKFYFSVVVSGMIEEDE